MRHSGTWAANTHRHPKASTTGAPTTTPSTGAPALDERPVAEGPDALLGLEDAVEHRHRRRAGRRPDAGAEHPEQDERRRIPRERDASREQTGSREADQVDPLVAPEVTGLPERGAKDRVREQRTGDDPGEGCLARAEVIRDRRDRDDEQRHGEADGEQPEERSPEDEPRVAVARLDLRDQPVPEHQRPGDDAHLVEARRVDHEVGLMPLLPRGMQVARPLTRLRHREATLDVGSVRGPRRRTAQPNVLGDDQRGVSDRARRRARGRTARMGHVAHPRVRRRCSR